MNEDYVLRAPVPKMATNHSTHDDNIRQDLWKLLECAAILELRVETAFAAGVYLHRCAATSESYPCRVMACLLLASKVHEEPRRLRDFVNAHHVVQDNNNNNNGPPKLEDGYWKTKRELVETERAVLQMLQWDVSCSYVHRAIAHLTDTPAPVWNCMTYQCLFSVACLQQPVLALAAAAVSVMEDRPVRVALVSEEEFLTAKRLVLLQVRNEHDNDGERGGLDGGHKEQK